MLKMFNLIGVDFEYESTPTNDIAVENLLASIFNFDGYFNITRRKIVDKTLLFKLIKNIYRSLKVFQMTDIRSEEVTRLINLCFGQLIIKMEVNENDTKRNFRKRARQEIQ